MNRLGQSTFDRPAASKARYEGSLVPSKLPLPLANGLRATVERHSVAYSAIVLLLGACGPATVLFAVGSVVVDPVDLCPGGRVTHVLVERHDGISPSVTDRDAAATVVGVSFVRGIATPLYHVLPYSIDGIAGQTVGEVTSSQGNHLLASTTSRLARGQGSLMHDSFFSTGTDAKPVAKVPMRTPSWFFRQDGESSEGLPGKVNAVVAKTLVVCYDAIRHGSSPSRRLCLERPSEFTPRRPLAFYVTAANPASHFSSFSRVYS